MVANEDTTKSAIYKLIVQALIDHPIDTIMREELRAKLPKGYTVPASDAKKRKRYLRGEATSSRGNRASINMAYVLKKLEGDGLIKRNEITIHILDRAGLKNIKEWQVN